MRNPFRWLSAFVLVIMLGGLVIAPVSAQDSEEEFDLNQLEGLQSGVGRFYYGDMSALMGGMMGTPSADTQMPENLLVGLSAAVFKFDGDDNAKKGMNTLVDELKKSMVAEMGDEGTPTAEIQETDVKDIGDEAKGASTTIDEGGMSMSAYLLMVRSGDTLIFLAGNGTGNIQDTINNIGKTMADRDAGDGDGTFNEDGTSTGGLWDVFPPADDENLNGLTNGGDEIIFPEDAGTPAA